MRWSSPAEPLVKLGAKLHDYGRGGRVLYLPPFDALALTLSPEVFWWRLGTDPGVYIPVRVDDQESGVFTVPESRKRAEDMVSRFLNSSSIHDAQEDLEACLWTFYQVGWLRPVRPGPDPSRGRKKGG